MTEAGAGAKARGRGEAWEDRGRMGQVYARPACLASLAKQDAKKASSAGLQSGACDPRLRGDGDRSYLAAAGATAATGAVIFSAFFAVFCAL
jgi:hypothetical protein